MQLSLPWSSMKKGFSSMPLAWNLRLPVPSKLRWSFIWVLVSVQYFWEQFFISMTLNKIPAPLSEGRGQSILSWSSWAHAMPYCWFSVQICLEELRAYIDLSVSDSFRRLWWQISTISGWREDMFFVAVLESRGLKSVSRSCCIRSLVKNFWWF